MSSRAFATRERPYEREDRSELDEEEPSIRIGSVDESSDSSPVQTTDNVDDLIHARRTNGFVLFFTQLSVMLKRNFILMSRHKAATIAQCIFAPIIFLLLLFILQKASNSRRSRSNYHPAEYPLLGVQPCQGLNRNDPCVNLLFTPDTPDIRRVLAAFDEKNAARTGNRPWGFWDNATSLEDQPWDKLGMVPVVNADFIYNYTLYFPNSTQYGIEFNFTSGLTANYRYQVWFNSSLAANGTDIFGAQLLALERGLDEAIISTLNDPTSSAPTTFSVTLKDWPTVPPSRLIDNIVSTLGATFFFCAQMIIFINILNTVVSEKEAKLVHSLVMFGLIKEVYWLAWFLSNAVLVFVCALVTCAVGVGMRFDVFRNANFGVLLVTFILFGLSMVAFAFFITTWTRQSRVAVLIGIFMFVIGLLFQSFVFNSTYTGYIWWDANTDKAGWIVLIFIPFFNFGKVFLDISQLSQGQLDELTNTALPAPGFTWDDLYKPIPDEYLSSYDAYGRLPHVPSPVASWYWMIMNIFFYGFLTWYLDKIIPDEFGQRKNPFFPFLPSTYGIKFSKRGLGVENWLARVSKETGGIQAVAGEDNDVARDREAVFNPAHEVALRIANLRKVYRTSFFRTDARDKVAVNDLCLTLKEGKLLALLGQNGAGKSTTMNIISGLTPATAGDALLYGLSVRRDMNSIRKIMGVCPQHDVLFVDLSAKEHIELYAGIKNIPRAEIATLMEDRLKAVRLWNVKHRLAGTYSGGMKRRLSMVIATLGDPKIVFLDEPTTGMDPVNRRHVWSFIENFKKGRVIVLTTHSMEEADVLGDRICVMAHGRLRALGNSIHLKNKFGAGYRISIVTAQANSDHLKRLIERHIPEAVLEDDSAGALIYQFPLTSIHLIPEFVKWLESKTNGAEIINAWGISQTTLEEVFLKLIRGANPQGYSGYEVAEDTHLEVKVNNVLDGAIANLRRRATYTLPNDGQIQGGR